MDHSPFAKLPPELRNQIWELSNTAPSSLALDNRHRFSTESTPLQNRYIDSTTSKHIAITQTCRKIRNETLSMFYSINTFEIRIDSGDVRRTTDKTYSGADESFEDEIHEAIDRLVPKIQAYHSRIARLKIVFAINPGMYRRDLWVRKEVYKDLLQFVEDRGYKAPPRLQIVAGIEP
jgi:hypothetical protein